MRWSTKLTRSDGQRGFSTGWRRKRRFIWNVFAELLKPTHISQVRKKLAKKESKLIEAYKKALDAAKQALDIAKQALDIAKEAPDVAKEALRVPSILKARGFISIASRRVVAKKTVENNDDDMQTSVQDIDIHEDICLDTSERVSKRSELE